MLSQTENVDHDSFHTFTSKQQVPIHQLRYLLKTNKKNHKPNTNTRNLQV